jgi:hypothetical protein
METKETFAGGATATKLEERFDLICPLAMSRLAKRLALGAERHGENNWCKGAGDPAYARARLNHALRHLVLYMLEGNKNDDNLGAAFCNLMFLIHLEEDCKHHER